MDRRTLLIAGGFVLAGGPALAKPAQPLGLNLAPDFVDGPREATTADVEASWWRLFEDPDLDRLVSAALQANYDIAGGRARLAAARAQLRETRTSRWPFGGVSAEYARRRSSGGSDDQNAISLGAQASWEIDLFGRLGRGIDAGAADLGGAQAALRGLQASVAAETASAYFQLRGAQHQLAIARQSVERQREVLHLTRAMEAMGTGTVVAIRRSGAELHSVEAELPLLEADMASARHRLAILTGQTPQGFEPPRTPPQLRAATVRQFGVGTPETLLRRRADIQVAAHRIAASSARFEQAHASLFPRVTLTGVIGILASTVGGLGVADALGWSAGPSLQWNVFDLPALRARKAARQAEVDEAVASYHQTVLEALAEVEDALSLYGAVTERLASLSLGAAAAREAATLAATRFRLGEGQHLEVLDAQRSSQLADAALARAATDHLLSLVGIHRALGGGWEVGD